MQVQLSVVIITYNEEKNIARCIDSVLSIADDIVIVDSFSKDKTEEICKSKGVRFVQHVFEGHIQQKNYAITQAQYPYVLSLDADEALDEQLQKSIMHVKENWEADGYAMNRLTNYCGKWIRHCGWYPDTKLRLWDSRKGSWAGVNPHDKFELHEAKSTVRQLTGDILHYSYYTKADHFKQVNYFTDIAAKANYEKGSRATVFHLLVSPIVKFFKDYIFKLGFLDGWYGLQICIISAYATFLKYRKMMKLQ
ncbi:MAG: glycosyltransferase family 2 protein [Bacteroidetes bacterium]|nr:glycosyltransferase family 2 protein [Bacteroidota bacterium]